MAGVDAGHGVVVTALEELPGVRLDLASSTLRLGERSFPAGVLVGPDGEHGGIWRGNTGYWWVCVPMENGAVVMFVLEQLGSDGTTSSLSMMLTTGRWRPDTGESVHGHVVLVGCRDGQISADRATSDGSTWEWENVEPEWAVEHMDRLSRMTVVDPGPGDPMTWLPLSQCESLMSLDSTQ